MTNKRSKGGIIDYSKEIYSPLTIRVYVDLREIRSHLL